MGKVTYPDELVLVPLTGDPTTISDVVQLYAKDSDGLGLFVKLNGSVFEVATMGGSGRKDYMFGDGQDGPVLFNGTSTVLGMSPSSSVYTLTRNLYCTDCVINSGVTVKGQFKIHCSGTLTVNGFLSNDGNAGFPGVVNDSGNGGAALSSGWYGAVSYPGTEGGLGAVNSNGSPGSDSTALSPGMPAPYGVTASGGAGARFQGGTGGVGGTAPTRTGGVAGVGGAISSLLTNASGNEISALALYAARYSNTNVIGMLCTGGAGGGGGGAQLNSSSAVGGGGGGGGSGGGVTFVACATLAGGGQITADGGSGGAGAAGSVGGGSDDAGGGGGGGGGPGGITCVVYGTSTFSGSIFASGGAGGAGGAGHGPSGGNGATGSNGGPGLLLLFNLSGDGT